MATDKILEKYVNDEDSARRKPPNTDLCRVLASEGLLVSNIIFYVLKSKIIDSPEKSTSNKAPKTAVLTT